ncbi:MAG: Gfo/Idh/MocA family oxidoreductase [FCB group bacterium]|jgi:predicted dehydrogenase|nr:Gfo/Idh/MocA family oxidoreductase [FCB group bacterium]
MNVGIIGCGNIGQVHAQMLTNCGLKLVACADTNAKKAKAMAAQYGAKVERDGASLVKRADIDIVAVTTPTPTHSQYVILAAQAGKHVFCEKPFGRNLEDCRKAIAAAKKAGVKLFVAHVLRYFQEFEAIRQQVEAGKVGKPGFVKTYRGGVYPHGENEWFADYAQSGGITFDCSIHDFDWIRYVFGDAERVFCQNLRERNATFMDYSLVTFRMKSGVIASTTGTWAHPSGFRVKVEVCGDNGMLTFDSADTPVSVMKKEVPGRPAVIVPGSPVDKSPYQLEWEDFIAWIEGKSEPRVTAEDGLEAVRMATAALESAEKGRPVRL